MGIIFMALSTSTEIVSGQSFLPLVKKLLIKSHWAGIAVYSCNVGPH